MTLQLTTRRSGNTIEMKVSGKLTKEDYQRFIPEMERLVKQHGKIRVLIEMSDFHGWTAGALWQDIKFDLKHFSDIERLALAGEAKWEKGMAVFCKPFTTAKVRYFDLEQVDEARMWIEAP